MNQVKIIFFDIDGTLLEMGKTEITPNTRKALCSLKQNGIKICIATGRSFATRSEEHTSELQSLTNLVCLRGLYLIRFWPLMDLSALQVIRWWQNVLFRKKI